MTRTPLPRQTRGVLGAAGLNSLGSGFTYPFALIYFNQVRGIPLVTAGAIIACLSAASLVASPLMGALADRVGSRRVLLGYCVASTLGAIALSEVHTAWQAFPVVLVVGSGWAAWSALNAFLATLTPPEQRARVFSINSVSLSAGIGIGGLLGAAIARVDDPFSFQLLYWIDAATYALAGVILFLATDGRRTPPPLASDPEAPGGWKAVLGDRVLRRLAVVFALVAFVGYGQLSAGLQAFATRSAQLSAAVVGAAFAVNTLVVVGVQWFTTRRVEGHRRTRAIGLFGVVMIAAWLVIGAAALTTGSLTPVVCLLGGMALIGVAETLWSPTGYAILNDLAPEHLRGRYNSLGWLTWELSATVGPLFASGLLAAGLPTVYVVVMIVVSALAGLSALGLQRHLTPAQNGVGSRPGGRTRVVRAGRRT